MSRELRSWTLAQHLANKQMRDAIRDENRISLRRDGSYIDVVQVERCGCHFQPFTECFFQTSMDRDGSYVIATGTPGCEASTLFAGTGVDPAKAGSIGHLGLRPGRR